MTQPAEKRAGKSTVVWVLAVVAVLALLAAVLMVLGNRPASNKPGAAILVRTSWPRASADSVRREITERVEYALSGGEDIDHVLGISLPGKSVVMVTFGPGRTVDGAVLRVQLALTEVMHAMPEGAIRPIIEPLRDSDAPQAALAVTGNLAPDAMRDAATALSDLVRAGNAVASLTLIGLPQTQIEIELDTARMSELGIDAAQVAEKLGAQATSQPASHTAPNRLSFPTTSQAPMETPVTIGQQVVLLKDFSQRVGADVQHVRLDGRNVVLVAAEGRPGVTTAALTSAMQTAKERSDSVLHHDVTLEVLDRVPPTSRQH